MVDDRSVRFNPANRYGAQEIRRRLEEQNPANDAERVGQFFGIQQPVPARATPVSRNTPAISSSFVNSSGERVSGTRGTTQTQPNIPAPAPVTRTPRLEDFAVPDYRDAEYNAQIAALDRALRDFETGAQQRAERYGIDYLQGVRNIGYRPAPGFVAMPNILEAAQDESAPMAARAITGAEEPDATAGMQGMWDIEGRFDPYSAAARGTRGLRDEFAARGTLRSSDFGQTFGEFQNRLNEQLEAMETGRTRFAEDLASELAQQRASTEERRQAAARAGQQRAVTERMNAFMRALAGG